MKQKKRKRKGLKTKQKKWKRNGLKTKQRNRKRKVFQLKKKLKMKRKAQKKVNLTFIFYSDGIPIWDVRPLPSMPQWPPGWDDDKWVAYMTNKYNSSRKKLFDRLYKSAVRKEEMKRPRRKRPH